MNELRQVANDFCRCLDSAIHAGNVLAEALYDLKSNLAFYAEGCGDGRAEGTGEPASPADEHLPSAPAAVAGGARNAVQEALVNRVDGAADEVQGERQKEKTLTTAKPEHRLAGSPKHAPLPDTRIAIEALAGEEQMPLATYYTSFIAKSRTAGCAPITQKGMRYLAYCSGYEKRRVWQNGAGYMALVRR